MSDLKPVSLEDVPQFASEDEEARFWAEHELDDDGLARMARPPEGLLPPPRGTATSNQKGQSDECLDQTRNPDNL